MRQKRIDGSLYAALAFALVAAFLSTQFGWRFSHQGLAKFIQAGFVAEAQFDAGAVGGPMPALSPELEALENTGTVRPAR